MQAARSLRERHPEVQPSHVAVALALATFADGPTGTNIRPGAQRIAAITGLNVQTVYRRIRWLVQHAELRRDKHAWPGSAACYTWVGGMGTPHTPTPNGLVVPESRDGDALRTTHQSHRLELRGLPGPPNRGGTPLCAGCRRPLGYLIEGEDIAPGALCLACFHGR